MPATDGGGGGGAIKGTFKVGSLVKVARRVGRT